MHRDCILSSTKDDMTKDDRFYPIEIERLWRMITSEYEERSTITGIPDTLFRQPLPSMAAERYGQKLGILLGVAAGPQTQLAQNILAAWLVGSRYIELKTVQTLDEIEVAKPCIDMADEGFNCEWSQELLIDQSIEEYAKAWVLIHAMHHYLDFEGEPTTIFNMSVGYDLEGILKPNVQRFFEKMADAGEYVEQYKAKLAEFWKPIENIEIPHRLSDNITLSTMHGCPPDEIEKIGRYLLEEKGLHTLIKLNPTLLGPSRLRHILNDKLGFPANVPDEAFGHDLKYEDGKGILERLSKLAEEKGLHFGVKLTNTLEVTNHRPIFPSDQAMMYMSGRSIHPVSINLAKMIREDFPNLDISFCGGVDAFNFAEVLACDLGPVTVCSDLLKPGGYGRMAQYIDYLELEMEGSSGLMEFMDKEGDLKAYADKVLHDERYRRPWPEYPSIKIERPLGWFDCAKAPCRETCPTSQDVEGYLKAISYEDPNKAMERIIDTNPLPRITGAICDHPCQSRCTRINYDNPIRIRDIKYTATQFADEFPDMEKEEANGLSVAVIGAGPSGLSAAWFLNLKGFEVDVYESRQAPGGMVSDTIPPFRIGEKEIGGDLDSIVEQGINIHFGRPVDSMLFENLHREYDFIYIATGAPLPRKLNVEGEDAQGVIDQLAFLRKIKHNKDFQTGQNVIVIGGGNSAMDAARAAQRILPDGGQVSICYRRTQAEMPADREEIERAKEEGIEIIELVSPLRIVAENGEVQGVIFCKNELGEPDSSGRRRPVAIACSEFEMEADTVIPALGQVQDLGFMPEGSHDWQAGICRIEDEKILIGGDAAHGAANVVGAIGEGRKAAEEIVRRSGIYHIEKDNEIHEPLPLIEHLTRRSEREYGKSPTYIPVSDRDRDARVQLPMTMAEARDEAARCLRCDEFCGICVTVCPNRANFLYYIEPDEYSYPIYQRDKENFHIAEGYMKIDQPWQILNVGDSCNECGNCTTFCPTDGEPFRDKPRVYISEVGFEAAPKGFFLTETNDMTVLMHRQEDNDETLTKKENTLIYETKGVRASLNLSTFALIDIETTLGEFSLKPALELLFVMNGILQLQPSDRKKDE